jgi:hypothetical protein
MTPLNDSQLMQSIRLDRALEYVVAQSWDELMPDSTSGLIHIEYHTGSTGAVDFLEIWASTVRGYWKRVCELWMQPLWSHATGLRFDNDYHSEGFAHNLKLVMGQEGTFSKLPDRSGLLQVHPPTQEERREADQWVKLALPHGNPVSVESHAAA